jgi:hypothetical protein
MITIIVKKITSRLKYTLKVVFDVVFEIPYNIILAENVTSFADKFTLNYTGNKNNSGFFIPNLELLSENEILNSRLSDFSDFIAEISSPSPLKSDIFSAVFFWISDYAQYCQKKYDIHDRHLAEMMLPYANIPVVNVLCAKLAASFPPEIQALILAKRKFDYEITSDIDAPWKHKNKPFLVQIFGFLKAFLKGEKENLMEKRNIWKGNKDPFDTFDLLFDLFPPEKTTFFFLIARHSQYDTRFTHKNLKVRELIQKVYQKKYRIGIHPSYTSFLDEKKINREIKCLSEIISQPIFTSRQHFLRFRLPNTFQYLEKAGIRHEYSFCWKNAIGFPLGMTKPFPWYDLSQERETSLILHPTMVMDRSLQLYMQMSPKNALKEVQKIIASTQFWGGTFTILIHNDAFSESGEWKGWREIWVEIVEMLKKTSHQQ